MQQFLFGVQYVSEMRFALAHHNFHLAWPLLPGAESAGVRVCERPCKEAFQCSTGKCMPSHALIAMLYCFGKLFTI